MIVFGLGRYGPSIAAALRAAGQRVLGVDFSREAVRHARGQGFDAIFGDAADPEFLGPLSLPQAGWLVLAVPERDTGVTHDDARGALLKSVRAQGYPGRVAVAAHREATAAALVALKADLVLMPSRDAAYAAARMIAGEAVAPRDAPGAPDGQRELHA